MNVPNRVLIITTNGNIMTLTTILVIRTPLCLKGKTHLCPQS